MEGIGHLLEKLKHSLFLKTALVSNISKSIEDILHIVIPEKRISLKNGVLFISSSPIIKSELMLNKNKIIGHIKEKHPDINISDIR